MRDPVADAARPHPRSRLAELSRLGTITAVAVLVGCGSAPVANGTASASQPTQTPPSSPCGGAGACITLTTNISGDVAAAGTETQARNTCADVLAADKFDGQLWLALPRPLQPLGGHDVMIYPSIYPWTGAGSYGSRAVMMTSEDGFITVDGVRYRPDAPGPSSRWQGAASVDAGGSGSMTFAGMLREGDPARSVAGRLEWSCRSETKAP